MPVQDAKKGMESAGQTPWMAQVLAELFQYFATGSSRTVTTTVKDILGRDPISFKQFVNDFAAEFK